MAVETGSWRANPTALWTDEGLGRGWQGCCSLFLPPVFPFGFKLLCHVLTSGFFHWWVPAVSVWGLMLPWLMADTCLCKLSLIAYIYSVSTKHRDLHPARWPVLFCRPTQESVLATANKEKIWERFFGKMQVNGLEISEKEIPGSKCSMHGNTLTYSRFWRKNL